MLDYVSIDNNYLCTFRIPHQFVLQSHIKSSNLKTETASRGHSAHSIDLLLTSCDITVSFRALSLKNVL